MIRLPLLYKNRQIHDYRVSACFVYVKIQYIDKKYLKTTRNCTKSRAFVNLLTLLVDIVYTSGVREGDLTLLLIRFRSYFSFVRKVRRDIRGINSILERCKFETKK